MENNNKSSGFLVVEVVKLMPDEEFLRHIYCAMKRIKYDKNINTGNLTMSSLKILSVREIFLFQCRYWYKMPYEKIGMRLGVSGIRARRMFTHALWRLRRSCGMTQKNH